MKRKAGSILLWLAILLFWTPAKSQVTNNSITQRIHLNPEGKPVQSTTAESTVEWECISRQLTGKCIVYHNDQWFTFSVPDPGKYFINIRNQVCKELYGIQMIIIEGNPCDTENYIIKRCISKLPMNNLFVEPGMLQADQLYLLNIDGFLGDYCSFEISLSAKPEGLPEKINHISDSLQKLSPDQNTVSLHWYAADSLLSVTRSFELYRKEAREKKFEFLATKNIQLNTAGSFLNDYYHTDTLTDNGSYNYLVVAQGDTSASVIYQQHVQWLVEKPPKVLHSITLPLTFSKEGPIEIQIIEPVADWVLKHYNEEFSFKNPIFQFSAQIYYDKGLRDLKVKVKNLKTREVNNFRLVVGESEWEFRQN